LPEWWLTFAEIIIKGQETKNLNDSITENVIKTLSGIEIKIEGPHSERFSYGSTMSPISLDYIKEIKILKTATLIFKGGGVIIYECSEDGISFKFAVFYYVIFIR